MHVCGIGNIQSTTMELPHTLHVHLLVLNLVSVDQLINNGCVLTFSPSSCVIKEEIRTHKQIGRGSKAGSNFYLDEGTKRDSCFLSFI